MINVRFLNLYRPLVRICLFLMLVTLVNAQDERERTERLVYHENFAPYRSVDKHIRIAQAFGDWTVETDSAGRYLLVQTDPEKGFGRGLLVWDLAPIRFQRLSVWIKALEPVDYQLQLSLAMQDVAGRSYVVDLKPTGKESNGWALYSASLREDTKRIYDQGKEVSPFVHGRGDVKTSFEGFDFDNVGFKAVFMHVDDVSGERIAVGFRDFQLYAEF